MRRGSTVPRGFIIITALACCIGLFIATQGSGFQQAYVSNLPDRFFWAPDISGSDNGTSAQTPDLPSGGDNPEFSEGLDGSSSESNVERDTTKPTTATDVPSNKEEQSSNEGDGKDAKIEVTEEPKGDGTDGDGVKETAPAEEKSRESSSKEESSPKSLTLSERKEKLPRCETFVGYCGYYRFSNRLKEMNRMLKVAMQTHRSLVVEDYYDVKFNEIMDFDKAEELLNMRAPESPCWLRVLSYDQYIDEGRPPDVKYIYCQRGNCGGKKHFLCHENWPPSSGLEEREDVQFHNSDKLIADNSSLIVFDGEAAFHYFQKAIPNFYSPFAESLYEKTRNFMKETMKDREDALPEHLANGGTSLGVHIRHDDQAGLFNLDNQLDFVEEHVYMWNITRMFIGTDAKKEFRKQIQDHFPYAQVRGDALCADDEHKNICVVYDQIAMSITDYFIGSVGSTFTDRIMDMRWFDAHNDTRPSYHHFDDSTGIKYQEGGWKSNEPEHIKKAVS